MVERLRAARLVVDLVGRDAEVVLRVLRIHLRPGLVGGPPVVVAEGLRGCEEVLLERGLATAERLRGALELLRDRLHLGGPHLVERLGGERALGVLHHDGERIEQRLVLLLLELVAELRVRGEEVGGVEAGELRLRHVRREERAARRIVLREGRLALRALAAEEERPAREVVRGDLRGERRHRLLLRVEVLDQLRRLR